MKGPRPFLRVTHPEGPSGRVGICAFVSAHHANDPHCEKSRGRFTSGEYGIQVTAIGPLRFEYLDTGGDPREQNRQYRVLSTN
jgi:hypothetical protein